MTDKKDKRKEAMERRDEADRSILAGLEADGWRVPVERFSYGSVRATLWASAHLPCVIELYRFYSTSKFYGLTSLLEASDLIHARRGLAAVKAHMERKGWAREPQWIQPKSVVLQAVNRGYNPPRETFIEGNIAALLWTNDINNGVDVVSKVELLSVPKPGVTECFFDASQIERVNQCLLRAEESIDRMTVMLKNSW